MKQLVVLLMLCSVAIAFAQERARDDADGVGMYGSTSRPFTPQELQAFRSVDPIDIHTHIYADSPAFISMLKKLNIHIPDIFLVDDQAGFPE